MEKSDIREKYKQIRSCLSKEKKQEYSNNLCQDIHQYIDHNNYNGYTALFAGTVNEPNLFPLLKYTDYKWCFPRVLDWKNKNIRLMEFFAVQTIHDLSVNSFGILEPLPHCKYVDPEYIHTVCVPAVSVDIDGNRIGMGGGFYDTFFSRAPLLTIAGVVFPEQVSKSRFIPDKWDIKMDIIFCGEKVGSPLFY